MLPTKVLIANRGEIAVRVIRACHELGIETVALYSEVDQNTRHTLLASEAYCVGPAPASESYLDVEKVLEVAKRSGADAIHPGYGFLSENAPFAQRIIEEGLIWIGPSPYAIEAMGSKTRSRTIMVEAGVPVVPGVNASIDSVESALKIASDIGYPVMLKAAAGGGGKGMREVNSANELPEAFVRARSEAINAFGDGAVYLEKRIVRPKHVEIQIFADSHGNTIHLFERDCSVQRRHQKVIEETPCSTITPETLARMADVAILAAKSVDYVGAGTVEFLMGEDQEFYFLEMNTRLQVEHPITEMVTGVDLVQAQIRIAAGERLWLGQEDVTQSGHAIECRIYAEDPSNNWSPSPGKLHNYIEPTGPWIRVDSGILPSGEVTVYYDPMIAKLVVWAPDRTSAIGRMKRALMEYKISGIQTNIPFFKAVLEDEGFLSGQYDTGYLSTDKMGELVSALDNARKYDELAMIVAAIAKTEQLQRAVPNNQPTQATASRWKWSYR